MAACTGSFVWTTAAPSKTKQRSAKSLQKTSLNYSNAKSSLQVPLTFNKVEKNKHKNFYFVHLLFLSAFFVCFFLARHNSKDIRFTGILNIPNNCSANLLLSYLSWASCELQLVSYGFKTVSEALACSVVNSSRILGMARIVRPHPDHWMRVLEAEMS